MNNNYTPVFKGELHGKALVDFQGLLDYDIKTYDERKKIVDEILSHPFFVEYFSPDNNYFNCSPNTDDVTSGNDSVCAFVEKLGSYLLYSDDVEEDGTVLSKSKEKRISKKYETPVNSFSEDAEPLDFKGNYKKIKVQKMFKSDFEDERCLLLGEYKRSYELAKIRRDRSTGYKVIKTFNGKEKEVKITSFVEKGKINKMMSELKETMIHMKDIYFGTIWFKRVMPDSCEFDENQIDFKDLNHIEALLECAPSSQKWYGTTSMALEDYLRTLRSYHILTEDEIDLLQKVRSASTISKNKISEELGIDDRIIRRGIRSIAKKVFKLHNEVSEDLWYLNMVKGKYKKCSKCGEIKLVSRFNKQIAGEYGVRGECKICRKI